MSSLTTHEFARSELKTKRKQINARKHSDFLKRGCEDSIRAIGRKTHDELKRQEVEQKRNTRPEWLKVHAQIQ